MSSQTSSQVQAFSNLSSALDAQALGARPFVPPVCNALNSPKVHGVYYLGDARQRPASSGEPWTENEYGRLVMLTARYDITKAHRWKQISYALAVNPNPESQESREKKEKDQKKLEEKNKDKKRAEDVVMEDCYYCHGCGEPNATQKDSCDACGTFNVLRSPEECFQQLPVLYYKYKEKVHKLEDTVKLKARIGTCFEEYGIPVVKETSQRERTEAKLGGEEWCYGEMNLEEFNLMLQRCRRIFGHMPSNQNGVFWDLGCGVGKLCVAAGCFHPFTQCWGGEGLRSLVEMGDKMISDWRRSEAHTKETEYFKDVIFRLVTCDVTENDGWVDNTTVCFCHCTCFSDEMMDKISEKARGMNVGCLFITTTKPLPDEKLWYKIGEDIVEMSWGKAKIFFHEKIAVG
ncbi:hypothetical protein TrRE_jg364 [Triparma retinervis]|uniref:Histone-lysine N-methyltransferase, H3 lysine-79 specific n=1 Tax=Triparma retinervis TaxID=2557542 RepID=A0A9W7FYW0_9STRA|nr:hypothetical protein TrRE_jg364 [Triparma retinervis]